MKPTLVIIGASYAGTQLAASAREYGFDGRIVLLGEEPDAPYQRPPLSKSFLTGQFAEARLPLRSPAFFDEERVEWRPSTRVTRIDRDRREVVLHDGTSLRYDHLALTTGARVRTLAIEGAFYLRDLADARRLAEASRTARSVVVIGGGYIGLEVAASLRQSGAEVTVVEAESRVLARVASEPLSTFVLEAHTAQGVQFRLNRKVAALHARAGHIDTIELDDGARLSCDLVVVGIGVVPNVELAQSCGLRMASTPGGGVAVDAYARTSDPAIVAAGDCASFVPHGSATDATDASALRIESVQNANDMAKTAAATIVGRLEPYRAVPWFWSDQYDLKLQMAGLNTGWTHYALRGSLEARKFSLFYFRGDALLAVDSVNRPQEHMLARKLLAGDLHPTQQQVSDDAFDLKGWIAQATTRPSA
ncbi:Rhodocoxin reductase [Pararobbsia alpina]|uniref:NAD(P)/FAD-dependent oxidoreductase n=1 Tax=Pararobbsia alpina TaxID=621374 RepID=UPI0039A4756E